MFTHGLENESYKCFACISWAKRTDGWHMWNGCNMIMKLQCVKLRLAISHIATEPVLMLNDTAECDLMEGFWTHQNVYCVFCVPFSPFKQRGAVHVQRWRLCELAESFGIRENKIWRTKKKKKRKMNTKRGLTDVSAPWATNDNGFNSGYQRWIDHIQNPFSLKLK